MVSKPEKGPGGRVTGSTAIELESNRDVIITYIIYISSIKLTKINVSISITSINQGIRATQKEQVEFQS